MRNPVATIGVAVALCALIAGAYAATTVGSLEPAAGTWRAYRGSGFATLVCSGNSEAAVLQCAAADAERRATSTRYQIRYPNRYATVTYSAPPPPPTTAEWTLCAQEWQRCSFTGTRRVRFGLGTSWVERDLTAPVGGIECIVSTFGNDPAVGVTKRCELRSEVAPPPPEPPPPTATGTATLSWKPPTQNNDGSALMDLAGYRVSYGASADALVHTVQIPIVTRYALTDLAPGTYYFAVRAYTAGGKESDPSSIATKVIL